MDPVTSETITITHTHALMLANNIDLLDSSENLEKVLYQHYCCFNIFIGIEWHLCYSCFGLQHRSSVVKPQRGKIWDLMAVVDFKNQ